MAGNQHPPWWGTDKGPTATQLAEWARRQRYARTWPYQQSPWATAILSEAHAARLEALKECNTGEPSK